MASPPPPSPVSAPLPRGFFPLILVVAAVFVLAVGALVYLKITRKSATPPTAPDGTPIVHIDQPPEPSNPGTPDNFVTGFFIPRFDVVNQDEKPVSNDVFKGKITVIDFFFSNCPFICPAMNGRFAQLATKLKDVPDVQFLSFSVDPAHDTPARLREYAHQYEADTARWQFLTGKKSVIWNILSEGLKWGIEERPEQPIKLPTGNEMSNIRHPGWFALIGPDGKVLAIYKYDVDEDLQRLEKRVRDLAAVLKD
jgi:cytochrome oxidase Cu insertion factor (SCO1/SenC/PrrC family)